MPDSELAGRIQAAFVGRALETSGMIALRGDFENEEIAELLSGWIGAELPGSGLFVKTGDAMIGRMAPDELLFIVPFEELEESLDSIRNLGKSDQISAADVSDMRAVFEVSGTGSRDVVAKGTPLDFSRDAFGKGSFRRTRLGQVAVMIWMEEEPVIRIACRRSESDYVEEFLRTSANADIPGFYNTGRPAKAD